MKQQILLCKPTQEAQRPSKTSIQKQHGVVCRRNTPTEKPIKYREMINKHTNFDTNTTPMTIL